MIDVSKIFVKLMLVPNGFYARPHLHQTQYNPERIEQFVYSEVDGLQIKQYLCSPARNGENLPSIGCMKELVT